MTIIKYIIILLIGAICFSTSLWSWNRVCHQVVAKIAYDNLTPKAKDTVLQLTKLFNEENFTDETFVSSAVWADEIKARGITAFNTWHYVNMPIEVNVHHHATVDNENVISAIQEAEQVLSNPKAHALESSLSLRLLIHFVADIHQPLHAATLYNAHFPTGDEGGNLYKIRAREAKQLHVLWDNCFNLTTQQYKTPKEITALAADLESQYPKAIFEKELQVNSPMTWAIESHDIAKNFVYTIPYYGTISNTYREEGMQVCKMRLVLAGYRLAQLMNVFLI